MKTHTTPSHRTTTKPTRARRRGYHLTALALALALLLPAALSVWSGTAAAACNYLSTLASIGSADGQVLSPRGIATDTAGNVYVVDTANTRVQKFNSGGVFQLKFGMGGSANGQFVTPFGVALDSAGNIYVTDGTPEPRSNGFVQKFDSSGIFLAAWGTAGQFVNGAGGVAVDSASNVYVAHPSGNRIYKFTSTGTLITTLGSGGSGDGQLNGPMGLAIDAADNLYVSEIGNNRVQVFNSAFTFVRKFGIAGTADGQFNAPSALAIDGSGNIHVADTGNSRIQVFDSLGNFVSSCGSAGSNNDQFVGPQGIAADSAGNVYVGDTGNDRVQKFGPGSPATPPIANAGPDQTVECVGALTSVTLNGTGSTAGSNPINSYSWSEGATNLGNTSTLSVLLPLGTHTITLTVTDTGGGSDTDDVVVTVQDTTAPIISCPSDIVVTLPANSTDTSAVVDYPAVTATDGCAGSLPVNSSPASGSTFPLGTTTVNATADDGNGHTASCSFTVTVRYNFAGFFQPVANPPAFNLVNAGRAVPVKFSLSGNKGLNIFAPGSPSSGPVACNSNDDAAVLVDTITAGGSSLSYDASSDQYVYVWKTESSWAGTCRQLVVTLKDGSVHAAYFKFK